MELYHWTITQAHMVVQILYFFLPAYLANMSPVLVRPWLRSLAVPIDGGKTLCGKRLLGDHKTWRGLLAGIFVGMIAYESQRLISEAGLAKSLILIDYTAHPLLPGLLMGLGAGVGDSVKSFLSAGLISSRGIPGLSLTSWIFLSALTSSLHRSPRLHSCRRWRPCR
jgi:CDP-2,3-bis-(O-geranylgeranyl)-sn-glycerol synthase